MITTENMSSKNIIKDINLTPRIQNAWNSLLKLTFTTMPLEQVNITKLPLFFPLFNNFVNMFPTLQRNHGISFF